MDNDAFKIAQLSMRQAEVEEAFAVLRSINEGKGAEIFQMNSRKEGEHLERWTNRLDIDQLVVGGHSFGATLAVSELPGLRKSIVSICSDCSCLM